MAAVKSRNNATTEIALARLFRKNKITGWRRHLRGVYGKPDFVFLKNKVAIFVDGCFWHGCKAHRTIPVTNKKFWLQKIKGNTERDKAINSKLRYLGWKVLRVWEHQLKKNQEKCINKIIEMLN
jgi:DNA mismatch endonuclease (patch repair protein)